jgi:tryptophan synthase alpha chain
MTRIAKTFAALRARGEAALIPYITAGDPDLDVTFQLVCEFEKQGADLLELGVPFSDPMADGPVHQRAAERGALRARRTAGGGGWRARR